MTTAAPVPEPAPEPLTADPTLDELARATVQGTPGARDRLLAELRPPLLRYCRARLGRRELLLGSADDVAQEICLAVVQALPRYRPSTLPFRAFVYGIAAHKVTDAYRAIGRNRSDPVAEPPDALHAGDGPEQQVLASELTVQLDRLLHHLTERQREVLVLRVAMGLSADVTAEIVGSTPGAVRVTQHRALTRLRGMLGVDPGPHQ